MALALPGRNACEAVLKQFGGECSVNTVPHLPLPQCTHDRCQCKFVPMGHEKFCREADIATLTPFALTDVWFGSGRVAGFLVRVSV
jgi:hypothetical protein